MDFVQMIGRGQSPNTNFLVLIQIKLQWININIIFCIQTLGGTKSILSFFFLNDDLPKTGKNICKNIIFFMMILFCIFIIHKGYPSGPLGIPQTFKGIPQTIWVPLKGY